MTYASEILVLLRTWIEDDSIDASFYTFINLAIREAECMTDWISLYGEKTVSVASGILTAPPEMHNLLSIYTSEQSGGLPKIKFSMRDSQPSSETGYVIGHTVEPYTPVQSSTEIIPVTITQGDVVIDSSLASPTYSSTWVGKRLIIAGYPDLFEITAVDDANDTVTVNRAPPFATGAYNATIQPEGIDRYYLTDKSNSAFTGDVLVKYQRKHPTIVGEEDRILINCPHTIALLALQNALITDKYSVDAERLNNQLVLAKSREVGTSAFSRKTNKFKDKMFSVRSAQATRQWNNG